MFLTSIDTTKGNTLQFKARKLPVIIQYEKRPFDLLYEHADEFICDRLDNKKYCKTLFEDAEAINKEHNKGATLKERLFFRDLLFNLDEFGLDFANKSREELLRLTQNLFSCEAAK